MKRTKDYLLTWWGKDKNNVWIWNQRYIKVEMVGSYLAFLLDKWFNKNKLKFFYHITPYSEIKLVSNTNQFLNVKVYEVDPPIYYQLMNQKILCAKVIEY